MCLITDIAANESSEGLNFKLRELKRKEHVSTG